MKNKWLQFKKRFHKYMCSIEDHDWKSPIFLLYLLFEGIRISILGLFIYFIYKFFKSWIEWIVR